MANRKQKKKRLRGKREAQKKRTKDNERYRKARQAREQRLAAEMKRIKNSKPEFPVAIKAPRPDPPAVAGCGISREPILPFLPKAPGLIIVDDVMKRRGADILATLAAVSVMLPSLPSDFFMTDLKEFAGKEDENDGSKNTGHEQAARIDDRQSAEGPEEES